MSEYCLSIVRAHDPNRFLLSLFAPAKVRPALWALYAFNHEIAKTREVVSDTTIGLIRLQWWRDGISEIYEGKQVRQHEVLKPLADAIRTHDLPRDLFENLIYAREFDLEGVAPAHMEGFIHYCDYTTTPLIRLSLKIIGEDADEALTQALSIRYARIGLLRATPFLFQQRRLMLPLDILTQYNLSEQKIFDFNMSEGLDKVMSEVLNHNISQQNVSNLREFKFLKRLSKMTDIYEAQLRKAGHDVFSAAMQTPPPLMALRLWAA